MESVFQQRTTALIGSAGQALLARSWVAVIGLGGVGSFVVEALARSGVGHLTIVDPDHIEPSNFNRQLPALQANLGKNKAQAVAEHLYDINPELIIDIFPCRYQRENHSTIIHGDLNYVIDAIDDVEAKIALLTACVKENIPVVSSMGTARRLNPLYLRVADIKDTSICPLARKVRRALRKAGIEKGVEVVYSQEEPVLSGNPDLGSMVFVPGSAGLLLAARVVGNLLDWQARDCHKNA